jgi:hypothetical protein
VRDNIKMVVKEIGREGWTEFFWPRIRKNDALLSKW